MFSLNEYFILLLIVDWHPTIQLQFRWFSICKQTLFIHKTVTQSLFSCLWTMLPPAGVWFIVLTVSSECEQRISSDTTNQNRTFYWIRFIRGIIIETRNFNVSWHTESSWSPYRVLVCMYPLYSYKCYISARVTLNDMTLIYTVSTHAHIYVYQARWWHTLLFYLMMDNCAYLCFWLKLWSRFIDKALSPTGILRITWKALDTVCL